MKFFIDILQAITLVIFSILSLPFLCIMSILERMSNKMSIKNNKLFQSPIATINVVTTETRPCGFNIHGMDVIYNAIFDECSKNTNSIAIYDSNILFSENKLLSIIDNVDILTDDTVIIVSEDMIEHVEFILENDFNIDESDNDFAYHKFLGFKKDTNIEIYSVDNSILSGNKMIFGSAFAFKQFDCVVQEYKYASGRYYFDGKIPYDITNEYMCLEFTDKGHP